jgi:hypothetical protein
VYAAAASVPVQWLLLVLLAPRRRPRPQPPLAARRDRAVWGALATGSAVAALVVIGCAIRAEGMASSSIQADEVTMYRSTQGLLARGFPSCQVHSDLPIFYTSTDELVYYGTALASLVFQWDRYVLRAPSVCWGTLTIVLIFIMGRRMFGRSVALVAATIYCFAPFCIQMAQWGRYPSQLQFMTLLTLYFYWNTLAGTGPINHRMLWLTTVSFIATFLTWEGAALIAPPMMVAALVQRRKHLRALLTDPLVWTAMMTVGTLVVLQFSHRVLQQNQRPWYGSGASEATLMPMWRYPVFDIQFYIWQASWNRDALVPMLGLLASVLLTIHHGFRRPARFLMLIFLGTCAIMSLLLSIKVYRYSYYMTPLLILLVSATIVAGARTLVKLVSRPDAPGPWRFYARWMANLAVVVTVALSSGLTIQLPELKEYCVYSLRLQDFKFPDMDDPVRYVREHLQEGDIVISPTPHVVDHRMVQLGGDPRGRARTVDYWLQTTLYLQAVLDDRRAMPLHRLCGTTMVPTKEALEDLFARHRRIWYVVAPAFHQEQNVPEVSSYIRQNMDIVYESFSSLVLFKGERHRTVARRIQDEQDLFGASANFLP